MIEERKNLRKSEKMQYNLLDKHFPILQKLKHTESDRLSVQVHAYLDNTIDVAQLLEDSEMKTEALERAEDIEDELSRVCLLELFLNTYSKLECLVIIEI